MQTSSSHTRFAPPTTEEEIQRARKERIPHKTRQDTKFCTKVWEAWREEREKTTKQNTPSLEEMNNTDINNWLSHFALEVRKQNGSEYPPNTLYHICAGLQRHLRGQGKQVDLLHGAEFASFQASLDGEMKRLQAKGLGSTKRQADIITEEEEDILWEKGQLGDSQPHQLLNTIIFYCGLHFALRSGKEHRQLRRSPCQIELVETPGQSSYLVYREDTSKNRQGGIRARNIKPKVVYHHQNTANPQHCFIRLFKKYLSLCPSDAPADAFYLQPSRTPTETCWFSRRPLGYHPLSTTVARICKAAGIEGYKTNHSLRATSTTRLYQSGADEQLVMERSGHRSVEGVRNYKRTSDEQRRALSDILNRAPKTPRTTDPPSAPQYSVPSEPPRSVSSALPSQPHSFAGPSNQFIGCTFNFGK